MSEKFKIIELISQNRPEAAQRVVIKVFHHNYKTPGNAANLSKHFFDIAYVMQDCNQHAHIVRIIGERNLAAAVQDNRAFLKARFDDIEDRDVMTAAAERFTVKSPATSDVENTARHGYLIFKKSHQSLRSCLERSCGMILYDIIQQPTLYFPNPVYAQKSLYQLVLEPGIITQYPANPNVFI